MLDCKIMIYVLAVLVFILAYVIFIDKNTDEEESFKANSNITSMELMNFDYLKNPNYKDSILANYTVNNNDARINGASVIPRPLAYPYTWDGIRYYYGTGLGTNNGINPNFLANKNAEAQANPLSRGGVPQCVIL